MRTPVDWPTRDLLGHRADATPDATAVVDAASGDARTYAALDETVDALAGRLAAAGLGRGDHLGALLETRIAFVRLVHAAARLGATLVPLNVRLAERELRDQADRADVDAVVCGDGAAPTATAIADVPAYAVDDSGEDGVDALGAMPARDVEPAALGRDDPALILFTSGTTGAPKPVVLTVGNLAASATASAFRLGIVPGDRWLVPLPMYHMGGLAPVLRSALYGTAVVVQAGFDAGATARAIGERGVTGVSLVPTMLVRLLDAGWAPPDPLRFVLLGGAPAPGDLLDRCAERGVPVHPTYGLTETASQVATARPDEAFEHRGTVGQPLVCTTVTVVDDGEPLPPGGTGELVVDGPTVTPGYYDAPDATEDAFGPHGLHTGDAGYRDSDGRLWVVGRLDDAITTGGETVHPEEVADVLRSHPAVRDAAVVGLPDREWGERVAALVVADGVDADDLRAHCRERLAGYKRPRTIEFADALPRTASGTVDRDAVRDALGEPRV